MALLTCTFQSKVLQDTTHFNAIIPSGCEKGSRVLYLLHGISDDYSAWCCNTSIERYANENGIVVIMPDAGRSFCLDMANGQPYYTFFTKEFFPYVSNLFSISRKREDTFIAGLSMGGYGALSLALRKPELFGAAASLSGPVDVCKRLKTDPRWTETQRLVFGEGTSPENTSDDLFYLVQNYTAQQAPRLFLSCGTSDFLYKDNVAFQNILSKTNIPHKIDFFEGIHDWEFWEKAIQKAIMFFCSEM